MLLNDVDLRVAWLPAFLLWRLACEEVYASLPKASVTEKFMDDLIESRHTEMELHSYGCIDARLP